MTNRSLFDYAENDPPEPDEDEGRDLEWPRPPLECSCDICSDPSIITVCHQESLRLLQLDYSEYGA